MSRLMVCYFVSFSFSPVLAFQTRKGVFIVALAEVVLPGLLKQQVLLDNVSCYQFTYLLQNLLKYLGSEAWNRTSVHQKVSTK